MKIQWYLITAMVVSFYSSVNLADMASVFEKTASQKKMIYISHYDSNNDLAISKKERDVLDGFKFSFVDKNNDLKIDQEEYFNFKVSQLEDRLYSENISHIKQSIIRYESLDDDGDKKIIFSEFSKSSERIFNMFDKNKDGILDKKDKYLLDKEIEVAEKDTAMDDRSDESLKKIKRKMSSAQYLLSMPSTHNWDGVFIQYDKNKTGAITKSDFEQQRKEVFNHADANSDGWLSDDEYIGEYKGRVGRRVELARAYWKEEIRREFKQKDSSNNQRLSAEEYYQDSKKIFNQFDVDGDGFVSLDDEQDHKKSMAKY